MTETQKVTQEDIETAKRVLGAAEAFYNQIDEPMAAALLSDASRYVGGARELITVEVDGEEVA